MNPLVSVVIAVRNGEQYLSAAIDSVRSQTYRPLELVVVDGRSTDNTAAIARSYKDVRYVLQANTGIADAYNCGVAASAGDFIAFLSHDDLWSPDKLQLQMECMQKSPDLQFCVSRVKFFLEPGCSRPPGFRPELLCGDHVAYIMETLLARKSVFVTVGGFNTMMSTGEDVDWFSRAKDLGLASAVVERVLVYKRVHGSNSSLNDPQTNRLLLSVLRNSIGRKRGVQPRAGVESRQTQ